MSGLCGGLRPKNKVKECECESKSLLLYHLSILSMEFAMRDENAKGIGKYFRARREGVGKKSQAKDVCSRAYSVAVFLEHSEAEPLQVRRVFIFGVAVLPTSVSE